MKLSMFFALSIVALLPLPAQQTIDNPAIIKMTKGHVPDPVILKMIATQPTQFEFSPERMIELAQAGVSENVIAAMLNRGGDSTATTPLPTQPVAASPPPSSQASTKIPAGLDVRLRVASPLTSEKAQEGDAVQLQVAEDVLVEGKVIIPQGSKATGYVSSVVPKGRYGASGRLTIVAKSVDAPDGSKISVQGFKGIAGGISGKSAFIPGYAPFARGKGAKVQEGTVILARTLGLPQ